MQDIITLQPFITILIDFVVIVLLVALFVRIGRIRVKTGDLLQIKNLEVSLKKTIADSAKLSDELDTRLEETMQEFVRLLQRLDVKGKRLAASIARAEEMAALIDRQQQVSAQQPEPYQRAIGLIEQGASDDEVHRQSGISREEIKLMRQLYQLRQNTDG